MNGTARGVPCLGAALILALASASATAGGDPPVRLAAPVPVAQDAFGSSVAVHGRTIVVGAPQAFRTGTLPGAAHVFVRDTNGWALQQSLSIPVSAGADGFGNAVAISGDTILVGAPQVGGSAGAAYVFARSGTTWSLAQVLAPADAAPDQGFGRSVAIEGDTAIVGASRDETLPGGVGAAYVFARSAGSWTQEAKLVASDGGPLDYFGKSVAISRGTALVGAFRDDGNQGSAYVFVQDGAAWSQQQRLTPADRSALQFFGRNVSLRGDAALIGAFGDTGFRGAAYAFARSGTTWTQEVKLTDPAAPDAAKFGSSTAVSWARSLVGTNADASHAGLAGLVVQHARSGGVWTERLRFAHPTAAANAVLGDATAISSGTLVGGAPGESADAVGAGAVYVVDTCVPADVTLPPVWTTGGAYAGSITPTGGTAPFAWRLVYGSLPDGVTLDPQTGAVAGVPTTQGSTFAVIELSDAAGNASEIEAAIEVGPPPEIPQQAIPPAIVGVPYRRTIAALGGVPPFAWSMENGGNAFQIDPATGVITGTPAALGSAHVVVHCTDATGAAAAPFEGDLRILATRTFTKNASKFTLAATEGRFETVLELVDETELSITAKGRKGFAPASMQILDSTDNSINLAGALAATPTGFRLTKYAVARTGRYTVRITPGTSDPFDQIAVTIKVAVPRKHSVTRPLAQGQQIGITFGVLAGSRVTVTAKAAKGSAADPRFAVFYIGSDLQDFNSLVKSSPGRAVLPAVTIARGGDFLATAEFQGGAAGDLTLTASIKPPQEYVYVHDRPAGGE